MGSVLRLVMKAGYITELGDLVVECKIQDRAVWSSNTYRATNGEVGQEVLQRL